MKNIKVVLFDVDEKAIIEDESMSDRDEIEFRGSNDTMFVEVLLKVDELALSNKIYTVVSRRFSIDTEKLVINVKLKNK